MFERFTDRARRVVVLAQEEARMFNHNYIGTEHLLLGLIHEGDGVAARALESFGLTLEKIRQQAEEIIGQGQRAPSGHIPFSPRAKRMLEFGLREAMKLGHNYIGTEHLLLGLTRSGHDGPREGVGAQVLAQLDVDIDRLREKVLQILRGADDLPASLSTKSPAAEGEELSDEEPDPSPELVLQVVTAALRASTSQLEDALVALRR